MRPSSKESVLEAAASVARRDGIAAVTFDSVSEEAGLSRGGILYHFPSKVELLRAMYQHLADRWDQHLLELLGKPFEESTPAERINAYVRAAFEPSAKTDMALLAEAPRHFDGRGPAEAVIERWSPSPADALQNDTALHLFIVRLVADGLWVNTSLGSPKLPPALQRAIVEYIGQLGSNR